MRKKADKFSETRKKPNFQMTFGSLVTEHGISERKRDCSGRKKRRRKHKGQYRNQREEGHPDLERGQQLLKIWAPFEEGEADLLTGSVTEVARRRKTNGERLARPGGEGEEEEEEGYHGEEERNLLKPVLAPAI